MKLRLSLQNKMILFLLPASILVFGGVIGYIITKQRKQMLELTTSFANTSLEKYASMVKSDIEQDFSLARGIAFSLKQHETFEKENRDAFFKDLIENVAKDHPNYASFWFSCELQYIDSNYYNKDGRTRYVYYRNQNGVMVYMNDSVDFDGGDINAVGSYQYMKQIKKEMLVEPYMFSYTGGEHDQILETSVCVPVLVNGNFIGLTGSDIMLDKFKEKFDDIDIGYGAYLFLVSNEGAFISYPDDTKLGSNIPDVFPEINTDYDVETLVKNGQAISFLGYDKYLGEEGYFSFLPISLGKANNPWSIGVFIPQKEIIKDIKSTLISSVLLSLLGVVLLSLIIWFIARNISIPIKRTTNVLRDLAHGNVVKDSLTITSGDEIEDMAESVNLLIGGLNRTADFALAIGEGSLNAEYKRLGDNDALGTSLIDMREKLIAAREEDKKRKEDDDMQTWATEGLAKFGEILRQHNVGLEELTFSLMSNLVDYVDAIQGGLFVKNDEDEVNVTYDMTGAIAYDRRKSDDVSFAYGEGLVGRCAFEKLTIYMEEVPENYVNVTSGLGSSNPRSILLVPAILNDEVYAIIELVSFNKFEKYQIEFVEKIGENIASTISNVKVTERTNRLLEQSKHQSEELAAQEEEMRQNLEELQATQDEVTRIRHDEQERSKVQIEEIEKHRKALLNILDHVPLEIFLKDNEGKVLIINQKVLDVHGTTREELIGKNDFDFIDDYNEAKEAWDADQSIISSGKATVEVHEELIDNAKFMLNTTKIPFYIDYLDTTGILGVQVDVTKLVEKEEEIKKLNAEIKGFKSK